GADLTLCGAVIPALALLERALACSLIVSNAGPDEAMGVGLESLLPSSVSVVRTQSSLGTVNYSGWTVLVELRTLAGFAHAAANVGPAGATAVVLKNTLAAGLSLVSATVSQGTLSQVGGVIRADFGQLAAASNATLNLQVRADQLGVWTNTAVVTAAEYDPDL